VTAGSALLAQALAYVDECLTLEEKRDFERRMAADPALVARIEQWRAQNKAIRKVFNENWEQREKARRAEFETPARRIELRRVTPSERELAPLPPQIEGKASPVRRVISAPTKPDIRAETWRRRLAPRCCALFGAALFCVLSATPAPPDRSPLLTSAAFSAYWAFGGAKKMEFATSEKAALERWLQPQLGGVVVIPDFSAAGFALLGGRVIPGAQGAAAFALYENGLGSRIGLTFEPGETTPASHSLVSVSDGVIAVALPSPARGDLTIVGKTTAADLKRLVGLARSAAPSPR
jgi:anti-sigma factor RsiW